MLVIRWTHRGEDGTARAGVSLVLDNGDVHHFFALSDGVHHSYTTRYRGRYDQAVAAELQRPGAHVTYRWPGP